MTAMWIKASIDLSEPRKLLWRKTHVRDYRQFRVARLHWRRRRGSLRVHLIRCRRKPAVRRHR